MMDGEREIKYKNREGKGRRKKTGRKREEGEG